MWLTLLNTRRVGATRLSAAAIYIPVSYVFSYIVSLDIEPMQDSFFNQLSCLFLLSLLTHYRPRLEYRLKCSPIRIKVTNLLHIFIYVPRSQSNKLRNWNIFGYILKTTFIQFVHGKILKTAATLHSKQFFNQYSRNTNQCYKSS